MSSRSSSPLRPRTPPRPRSPITTTFQIRGVPSVFFNHEITLSNREYDELIRAHPEAALSYIDDDDGDVITVGSGNELHARVLELLAYPPPPPPAIFDIDSTSHGFEQWQRIIARASGLNGAKSVMTEAGSQSSREAIYQDAQEQKQDHTQTTNTRHSSVVEEGEAGSDVHSTKDSAEDAAKVLASNQNAAYSIIPLSANIIDEQSPFIASFEAEINRILEEALSHAGTPRALSPKPEETKDEADLHDQDKVYIEEGSYSAPINSRDGVADTDEAEIADEFENGPRGNPAVIVADVFNSVLKSITRVAQDATAQAARTFPQHFSQADGMSSASRSLEAFNNAVQDVLVKFTAQLHTLASEAVISAQDPKSRPGHPAAIFRNLAETVGHLAVENAGKIREEIRFAGADAGAEARRAGEDLKKAADEVRKAAQIVGQEFGKTGRVVGKIAEGAGKEVGKAFGNGAGFVSGFAGGIVRNLTGSTRASASEIVEEAPEETDTDDKRDEMASKFASDILNGLPSSFGSVSAPRSIPVPPPDSSQFTIGNPPPRHYLNSDSFLPPLSPPTSRRPQSPPLPLSYQVPCLKTHSLTSSPVEVSHTSSPIPSLPSETGRRSSVPHFLPHPRPRSPITCSPPRRTFSERDPFSTTQYRHAVPRRSVDPFLPQPRSNGSWGGFGRTNGRAGQTQFIASRRSGENETDISNVGKSSERSDPATRQEVDHTKGRDFSEGTSDSQSSDSEEETSLPSDKPKHSGYSYIDPGLTRSEREAWRAKWRSIREDRDPCHPSRRGVKFQYHFRPHVVGPQARTARYGRRRRGSFSDDKVTFNPFKTDRSDHGRSDETRDRGNFEPCDGGHFVPFSHFETSHSSHAGQPNRDFLRNITSPYPFKLDDTTTRRTGPAASWDLSRFEPDSDLSFLEPAMRDLFELPAPPSQLPSERRDENDNDLHNTRRRHSDVMSLSSSVNVIHNSDPQNKSEFSTHKDISTGDEGAIEKEVTNNEANETSLKGYTWTDAFVHPINGRSFSPAHKIPGEGEIRRKGLVQEPTFPALRKSRTTSDGFGKDKDSGRPWLHPWLHPAERTLASFGRDALPNDDVLTRFPSLAELSSALPSLDSLNAHNLQGQRPGLLDDVPTPSSLTSSLQNAFPAMTPTNVNTSPNLTMPSQNDLSVAIEEVAPLSSLSKTLSTLNLGATTPLLSIPGEFPVDDADSSTSTETARTIIPQARVESRSFSQIARDEAREALRLELAAKTERDERERQRLVELELAPKIVECVKTMVEMGYSEMGIDHLGHIAEMVDGNLEEAIDAVEEERQAWERIKLGAEQ